MMHVRTEEGNGIVVSLTNAQNKAFREYDFRRLRSLYKRQSSVVMPFDSEYKIMIKNDNPERLLMHVDIDGTEVTGSSGLVIPAWSKSYLERFFETDKKFKFVPAGSDGVADPTDPNNGLIRVKLVKEYTPRYNTLDGWTTLPGYPNNDVYYGSSVNCSDTGTLAGSSSDASPSLGPMKHMRSNRGNRYGGVLRGVSGQGVNYSCSVNSPSLFKSADLGEAGATVEGNKSHQTFGKTDWLGDVGPTYEFIFKVSGEGAGKEAVRNEIAELRERLKNLENQL